MWKVTAVSALLIAVVGCASVGPNLEVASATSSTVAGDPPPPPPSPQKISKEYVYVASQSPYRIEEFSLDLNSGALLLENNDAADFGSYIGHLFAQPNGAFLYVADVFPFSIDPATGGLREGTSSTAGFGGGRSSVITPDGSSLYSAADNGEIFGLSLHADSIGPATGPFWGWEFTSGMTISPSGKFLYVSGVNLDGTQGTKLFSIRQSAGLAPVQLDNSWKLDPNDTIYTFSPDGRFALALNREGSTTVCRCIPSMRRPASSRRWTHFRMFPRI